MGQTDSPLSDEFNTLINKLCGKEIVDLESRIQGLERKAWNEIESPEIEVSE